MRFAGAAGAVMFALFFFACTACAQIDAKPERIALMSYNVQALFDPVDNGNEYKEYSVAKGTWDEERYHIRLENISSAILAVCPEKPDILFVQEIENERVLKDLAEQLGGYAECVAAPRGSGSITVGILSKFPITMVKTHQYQTVAKIKPSLRLLLEVQLDIYGVPVIVLNAHWKSKKEGAEATEIDRRMAAELVKSIITERKKERLGIGIILGGDLNTNPDEYERVNKSYITALMPQSVDAVQCLKITGEAQEASDDPLVLFSPWFLSTGYSYMFNGTTERIDNYLLTKDFFTDGALIAYSGFTAEQPAFLVNESGVPCSWNNETRTGYSDHLPIMLWLETTNSK